MRAGVVAALAGLTFAGVALGQVDLDQVDPDQVNSDQVNPAAQDDGAASPTLQGVVSPEALKLLRMPGSVVAREGVLNLRTGDVAVAGLANILDDVRAGKLDWIAQRDRVHVLVTRGVLTAAQRDELDRLGVRRMGYLPSHAWIVDLSGVTPTSADALAALGYVTALTPYQDAWKLDPFLAAGANARVWQTASRKVLATRDADKGGRVGVAVHAFANQTLDRLVDAIRTLDGVEVYSSERVLDNWAVSISLPASAVADLATLAPVQFAEMAPEYTQRSNSTTRWVIQSNVQSQMPLHARGLLGQGQVVGFMDFGLGWEHCSFSDPSHPIGPTHRKLVAYNAPLAYDLHGTHVAGTLAGDGGNTGNTRGIAYLAKIAFNTPPTLEESSHLERYSLHESQGAFIHSNSWGADFVTEYDGGSRAIDAFTWTHDDSLICFSVSNSSLLSNPENAKNCLAVSLCANAPYQDEMPCGGASGPTIDGRMKPELVAPGCSITSSAGASTGSCGTTTRTGTSMAQPAVAAVCVLTRQYFVDGFYHSGVATAADAMLPSGALIKAVVSASGQDLASVEGYPTMREGFGRVLADAALYFDGDASRLLVRQAFNQSPSALDQGATTVYRFTVTDDDTDLRLMLAWHDYPGTIGTTFAPVNNLDLVVVAPDGTTFLGNAFAPNGHSRTIDEGANPDLINNLEGVVVDSPECGVWTVRIEGTAINVAGQGFGLAITGKVNEYTGDDCLADFDHDGGITGNDIAAFVKCYEQGLSDADVDFNGGIDAADLALFFARFEAGC